jgi:hypothetical protein
MKRIALREAYTYEPCPRLKQRGGKESMAGLFSSAVPPAPEGGLLKQRPNSQDDILYYSKLLVMMHDHETKVSLRRRRLLFCFN